MKLYGKVDESWDDAKFQAMIEDALRMARAEKKVFAVGQNMDGTAVVALSKGRLPANIRVRGDCVRRRGVPRGQDSVDRQCRVSRIFSG